jgi:hypothetical protein
MNEVYLKATDTLEVLMCKLGMKERFLQVIDQYDFEK